MQKVYQCAEIVFHIMYYPNFKMLPHFKHMVEMVRLEGDVWLELPLLITVPII